MLYKAYVIATAVLLFFLIPVYTLLALTVGMLESAYAHNSEEIDRVFK